MSRNTDTNPNVRDPEVLPPEGTTVVTGHRVVPRKERFIVDAAAAENAGASVCGICEEELAEGDPIIRVADEGLCHADCVNGGSVQDDVTPLSEAELLFESIGTDVEEYAVRVDHLTNYSVDGKSDTRAERKFCRWLRGDEVRLDYLETVRRSCRCECLAPGKEGEFSFVAFKLTGNDRGIKRRWHDGLTKALAEDVNGNKPESVAHTVVPASSADPLAALNGSLDTLKKVRDTFFPIAPTSRQVQEAAPPDPVAELEKSLGLAERMMKIVESRQPDVPISGGGDSGTLVGVASLVRELGLRDLIVPLASAFMAAKMQMPGAASAPANGNHAQHTPGPEALPPNPLIEPLTPIVEDLIRDADVDRSVAMTVEMVHAQPVVKPIVAELLESSPVEILMWLAQQTPAWQMLLKVEHAADWVADYRDALREQLDAPPEPPPFDADTILNSDLIDTGGEQQPAATPIGPPDEVSTGSGSDRVADTDAQHVDNTPSGADVVADKTTGKTKRARQK